MGDWPEAERCHGSPELIRLHSTMGEQLGLICLWSLSGNLSRGEEIKLGKHRWHSLLASGSPWPTCVQQGALLLSCSPAESFLVPGLFLSPQTSELHSAELLRRCFACLIQTQTTSSSAWQFYVDE